MDIPICALLWPGAVSPCTSVPQQGLGDQDMSKGNNKRGNKEAKKPKAEKVKVSATANSNAGKPLSIGGKPVK
jgi:hypothetical protein